MDVTLRENTVYNGANRESSSRKSRAKQKTSARVLCKCAVLATLRYYYLFFWREVGGRVRPKIV